MTKQGIKEIKQGEARANQILSRNEAFINRKKREDEQNNQVALSDITGKGKLRKKRQSETFYQQQTGRKQISTSILTPQYTSSSHNNSPTTAQHELPSNYREKLHMQTAKYRL